MQNHLTRRRFMGGAVLAAAAAAVPFAKGATLATRQDWKTFRRGRHYASFVDAIRKMKANATAGNPRNWVYWAQIHRSWCTHHVPYFLAWHRGYLALIEKQLRAVSGNPALTLPYWDYYADPTVPAEFTDPSPWNPLYNDRINTNVAGALSSAPFGAGVTSLQGSTSSFEYMLENKPHDPVHDLIGSTMATMDSPLDPIFWLHHANIDRLWNAWVAAGGGRANPPSTDPYWDGNNVSGTSIAWQGAFKYADTTALPTRFTMPPRATIDTRASLGYFYDNEQLPASITPTAALRTPVRQSAPLATFATTTRRRVGTRLALGGVRDLVLGPQSVAFQLPLDRIALQALRGLLGSFQASPFGLTGSRQQYTSVKVVLADVMMTDAGARGGFFYDLTLDLPSPQGGADVTYSFGNLGPFRVAGLQHHGHTMAVTLEFDITELLLRHGKPDLGSHRFLLDRINGRNTPGGDVMQIGEIRLELA